MFRFVLLLLFTLSIHAQLAPKPAAKPAPGVARSWKILEDGIGEKSADRRVRAIRALGTMQGNALAVSLVESKLQDEKTEVRAAAATALGELKSQTSRAKIKILLNDKEVEVVLAAANALYALNDPVAYDVFYAILTGQSKTHSSLTDQARSTLSDPGKLTKLGVEAGIGFIPYGGASYSAFKMLLKDDVSPIRGAAALKLAHDPDARAEIALVSALDDKKATVRAAAVSALAIRNDAASRGAVEKALDDSNETVRYNAAAAYLCMTTTRRRKAQ